MNREELSAQFSSPLLSFKEIKQKISSGAVALDVRSPEEVAEGRLEGAVCIPHDQIAARIEELKQYQDQPLVVFCKVGGRADRALQVLKTHGFSKVFNAGGLNDMKQALQDG